jgi:hypothetical protein
MNDLDDGIICGQVSAVDLLCGEVPLTSKHLALKQRVSDFVTSLNFRVFATLLSYLVDASLCIVSYCYIVLKRELCTDTKLSLQQFQQSQENL